MYKVCQYILCQYIFQPYATSGVAGAQHMCNLPPPIPQLDSDVQPCSACHQAPRSSKAAPAATTAWDGSGQCTRQAIARASLKRYKQIVKKTDNLTQESVSKSSIKLVDELSSQFCNSLEAWWQVFTRMWRSSPKRSLVRGACDDSSGRSDPFQLFASLCLWYFVVISAELALTYSVQCNASHLPSPASLSSSIASGDDSMCLSTAGVLT